MEKYSNLDSVEKEERTASKKREWCRSIALIPAFIAAICIFPTKAISQNNVNATNGGIENPITNKDSMITREKGVSQELLTEYQEIVNKYLEKDSIGNPDGIDKFYWKSDYLSEKDWTQLYVIFVQMTENQQKEQMISFFEPPRAINRAQQFREKKNSL